MNIEKWKGDPEILMNKAVYGIIFYGINYFSFF